MLLKDDYQERYEQWDREHTARVLKLREFFATLDIDDANARVPQLRKVLTTLFKSTYEQMAQLESIEDLTMDTPLHPIFGELFTDICDLQADVFGVRSELCESRGIVASWGLNSARDNLIAAAEEEFKLCMDAKEKYLRAKGEAR